MSTYDRIHCNPGSGFMYKFNQHKLYTEQTESQQIIHMKNKLYQLHIVTGKNSVKKEKEKIPGLSVSINSAPTAPVVLLYNK
jgi:hypothetical protein